MLSGFFTATATNIMRWINRDTYIRLLDIHLPTTRLEPALMGLVRLMRGHGTNLYTRLVDDISRIGQYGARHSWLGQPTYHHPRLEQQLLKHSQGPIRTRRRPFLYVV